MTEPTATVEMAPSSEFDRDLPTPRNRTAIVGVVIAVAVVAAGAVTIGTRGGGSKPGPRMSSAEATRIVHAAAAKATRSGSAKLDITFSAGGGSSQTVKEVGLFRMQPLMGAFTLTGPSVPAVHIRLTSKSMYLQVPPGKNLPLPSGRQVDPGEWLGLTWSKINIGDGANFGQLVDQARQSDPLRGLQLVRATNSIHELGPTVVDGVHVTGFEASISPAALARFYTGAVGKAFRHVEAREHIKGMSVEVWVDRAGQLVQLTETLQRDPGADLSIAMHMYDYGVKVRVAPPPANRVVNLTPADLRLHQHLNPHST